MLSKKPKLTQEMVSAAKERLEAIPPAAKELRPMTVADAIRTLTPTIRRLLERGHTREYVLELLREQGIECSPSTFKECYRPAKSKPAGKAVAGLSGEPSAALPPTNGSPSATGSLAPVLVPPATAPTTAPTVPRLTAGQPTAERKVDDGRSGTATAKAS
jgi:hypothetical protein